MGIPPGRLDISTTNVHSASPGAAFDADIHSTRSHPIASASSFDRSQHFSAVQRIPLGFDADHLGPCVDHPLPSDLDESSDRRVLTNGQADTLELVIDADPAGTTRTAGATQPAESLESSKRIPRSLRWYQIQRHGSSSK